MRPNWGGRQRSRGAGAADCRQSKGWGLTALRVVTGGFMAGHGIQKLRDPDTTGAGFDWMGLKPGRPHALVAGVTETASGVATVLGLCTPAASAAITGTMTVAIAKVHGRNGPWITKGGYEYNATLLASAFALAASGPGALALDGRVTRRRAGVGWAVAQAAVGAGTAFAVMKAAERRSRPAPEPTVTVDLTDTAVESIVDEAIGV